MFVNNLIRSIFTLIFFLSFNTAEAYLLTGVTNFNFGTAVSPFADLTMTDNSICVSAELLQVTNYHLTATSSGGTSSFQLLNGSNTSYTLAYSVAWASPTTFVALSSGVAASFSNAHSFLLPCPGSGNNAQLKITILGANQMLAKQGNYSDTLTITIAP